MEGKKQLQRFQKNVGTKSKKRKIRKQWLKVNKVVN